MRITSKITIIALLLFVSSTTLAQKTYRGNISGYITDQITKEALIGANIIIEDSTEFIGTVTNEDGYFSFKELPVGRHSLKISYIGFYSKNLANIYLGSGKELVLNIELEESVIQGVEVEIIAKQEKTKALNRMASVSARSFSIEETQRYAGARNDISRMASNFAGVNQGNDSRNDIIIRGNSPIGLLWRYEGVDIPNPNHYGAFGSTGGPVSILNNNVLSNSDFFTGAFPSEYGNAISGVFDIHMRNGNSEQHEFLGQIGFNGFELTAEGPFSKKSNASYLISYRYSTLGLMAGLGVDFGTGTAIPEYQDLSMKINIPTKKAGVFSLFAVGGKSYIEILKSNDTTAVDFNLFTGDSEDLINQSSLGVMGVKHNYIINNTSFIRSVISASYHDFLTKIDSISTQNFQSVPSYRNNFKESKISGTFFLSKKVNTHHNYKVGVMLHQLNYNLIDSIFLKGPNSFIPRTDYDNSSWQIQPYISWQYRMSEKFTINGGLHYLYYSFNNTNSLEPRLGMKYNLNQKQNISFGYGLHSQTQPFTSYVKQAHLPDGSFEMFNENLDLLKSHHFVLGYDWNINEYTRLKTEVYYQYIFNAAVNAHEKDSYSILNQGADFHLSVPDTLNNEGTGINYGLEITLEQFMNRGFYYLMTASFYESKYKGSNGLEHHTAFNGNYIINGLLGKEFEIGKNHKKSFSKNTLFFDVKATYAGGKRYTPIDVDKTIAAKKPVYIDALSFEKQFDDYFRFDIKIGFKQEFKKFSMEFSIDAQNIFNVQNIYLQRVNTKTGELIEYNQIGRLIIPQFVIRF